MTDKKKDKKEEIDDGTDMESEMYFPQYREQIIDMRTVMDFVIANLDNLTSLYVNDEMRDNIRKMISHWRWFLSHNAFKDKKKHLDKPSITWLHSLMMSHRSIHSCVALLATPGVGHSLDAQAAIDIILLKFSRIYTYTEVKDIPNTFYLPPSDPRKTDQYGVKWSKSDNKAAVKYRKRLTLEKKDRDNLTKERPRYQKTEKELKEYLAVKNERRQYEKDLRKKVKDELRMKSDEFKAKNKVPIMVDTSGDE